MGVKINLKFIRLANKYLENNWGKDKGFEKEYEYCMGVHHAIV